MKVSLSPDLSASTPNARMNSSTHNEENLREAAAIGNEDGVRLILSMGVNVNSQNSINGWYVIDPSYVGVAVQTGCCNSSSVVSCLWGVYTKTRVWVKSGGAGVRVLDY